MMPSLTSLEKNDLTALLSTIRWNSEGLITAIAQDWVTQEVLMLAWMNEEALVKTLHKGEVVYWSRSRKRLWHKGEESGHFQKWHDIFLDCDGDALLLKVEQIGLACHTGRRHCFFHQLKTAPHAHWEVTTPIIKEASAIYRQGDSSDK